ncbi:MAG: patatin-like phospholipase family protein [Catalinimonas sp.]
MSKLTRVLSIDGGGIRAIIPAQILTALEGKLKKRAGNPDARLADHFDLIAGTGTGGLLTCFYLAPQANESGHPRFAAEEVAQVFLKRGAEVYDVPLFHRLRSIGNREEKYPAGGLQRVIDHFIGKMRLSELLKPCVIPAYDITRRELVFFRQHQARQRAHFNFQLRDVARVTSTIPTYFETPEIEAFDGVTYPLIDGGLMANNPAMCAYGEARELFSTRDGERTSEIRDFLVFSLGTGQMNESYPVKKVRDWNRGQWAQPMYDMAAAGQAELVDVQLRQLFDAAGASEQYVRLNPPIPLTNSSAVDDASDGNLRDLRVLGSETAGDHDDVLERVDDKLLSE